MAQAATPVQHPGMARLPRFFVPGVPLHVIQRGNDRQPIFHDSDDLACFRDLLRDASRRGAVALHAYVLMTNHVHLLMTPTDPDGVPRTMQAIGRSYVQRFNRRCQRTGTLWEGRYKAAIVDDERYLITCMRYIELNPVRAGLVALPAAHAWSSHAHNAGLDVRPGITPHEVFLRLGRTPEERGRAWSDFVSQGICDDELQRIRKNLRQNRPYGSVTFEKEKGRVQEPSPFA